MNNQRITDDTPSKRDMSGRIVGKSRSVVPKDIDWDFDGEYREMCRRCSKELQTFPKAVCWYPSGSKSVKCADCKRKNKACEKVSSPVSRRRLADEEQLPPSILGEGNALHDYTQYLDQGVSGEDRAKAGVIFSNHVENAVKQLQTDASYKTENPVLYATSRVEQKLAGVEKVLLQIGEAQKSMAESLVSCRILKILNQN